MTPLRPGYHRTDVGTIPDEWEVRAISEIARPVRGSSPRPAGDPRFFAGSHVPWVTVASLTGIADHQTTVTTTESMLTEEGQRRSRTLQPGTVIIANSGFSLGVAKILGTESCANDGIAALLKLRKDATALFIVYWINFITDALRATVAIGNEQPNLNTDRIGKILLPLPPPREQRAISRALSDADALIASLEALIVKKRDIKRGAMQELLTGERRLPGFRSHWLKAKFGTHIEIRNLKVPTLANAEARTCVELEQMVGGRGTVTHFDDASTRRSIKYQFVAGDVLFGRLRPYLRKYWLANRNGVCSTEIWPLVARGGEIDQGFILYIVQTDGFIEAASAAYGTHMPRADWKMIVDFMFQLPPSLDEQRAIASVLSDMDAEISALEEKLVKARAIKRGMMQVLLTGEVRLV